MIGIGGGNSRPDGIVDVALVGVGDIGRSAHLPALLRHPRVRLVGLVDTAPGTADLAADLAPGAPVVARWTDLPDPDGTAFVVATPPWVSTALAVELATSGHYVLMEKPVATSSSAAAPLRTIDDVAARRIQVGLTYRHHPAFGLLRSLVDHGRFGCPLLIRAHIYDERWDPANGDHTARLTRTIAHGAPIIHEGAHLLDWLHHLVGPPTGVADTWSVRTDPALPGPNVSGGRLSYADGSCAVIEVGWLTRALPPSQLTLHGAHGYATLDTRTFAVDAQLGDEREHLAADRDRTAHCFDLQLDRFVDLVCTSGEPDPSLADGLRALDLSERLGAETTEAAR